MIVRDIFKCFKYWGPEKLDLKTLRELVNEVSKLSLSGLAVNGGDKVDDKKMKF